MFDTLQFVAGRAKTPLWVEAYRTGSGSDRVVAATCAPSMPPNPVATTTPRGLPAGDPGPLPVLYWSGRRRL